MEGGQLRKQEERSPMTKSYHIPKKLIWEAYQCVKANGRAAGIDGESIEAFERCVSDNLYKLWNRMCSDSFFRRQSKVCRSPGNQGVYAC